MTASGNYGGFYQFPLCLLAAPLAFEELATVCFQNGVCRYLDAAESQSWRHIGRRDAAFGEAREVIGFQRGHAEAFLRGDRLATEFAEKWQRAGRKTCFVRMRTDLHFAALSDDSLNEREWRCLAGIFSAVGDKPMVKLSWQSIQFRAAGWLSAPLPTLPGSKPSGGPIYPRGQIERTLTKLLDRGFLFCATYRRGERYWSHRLDQAGIWKEIEKRKLSAARAAGERRKIDAQRGAAISAQIEELPAPHAALRAI